MVCAKGKYEVALEAFVPLVHLELFRFTLFRFRFALLCKCGKERRRASVTQWSKSQHSPRDISISVYECMYSKSSVVGFFAKCFHSLHVQHSLLMASALQTVNTRLVIERANKR